MPVPSRNWWFSRKVYNINVWVAHLYLLYVHVTQRFLRVSAASGTCSGDREPDRECTQFYHKQLVKWPVTACEMQASHHLPFLEM